MPERPDLLRRRTRQFALWRPGRTETAPRLVIGQFTPGPPPGLEAQQTFDLCADQVFGELWTLDLADTGLPDGTYHYWFEVDGTNPYIAGERVYVTDPCAGTADWRLLAPADTSAPNTAVPAAVVSVSKGALADCDPSGLVPAPDAAVDIGPLAPNNRTVVYELPTAWTRAVDESGVQVADGTFADVLSLVEPASAAPSFPVSKRSAPGAHTCWRSAPPPLSCFRSPIRSSRPDGVTPRQTTSRPITPSVPRWPRRTRAQHASRRAGGPLSRGGHPRVP